MVDEFIAAGGSYFDTAWAYQGFEDAARQALVDRYPRDSYTIATKNAAWAPGQTADSARAQLDVSLGRLGTDYVDYYLFHSLDTSHVVAFEELGMWDWALEQKRAGKIRHLGSPSMTMRRCSTRS